MAGMGVLGTALSGAMVGAGKVGEQMIEHASKLDLQEAATRAQLLRDETLSRIRRGDFRAEAETKLEFAPQMARAETAALAEREDALRPGKLETKRGESGIAIDEAFAKPRTLGPGSSEVVDGEITLTAPQKELDPSQQAEHRARAGYYSAMAKKAADLGVDKTALISNVDYLVRTGIASDPAVAFEKLRTGMGKPESAQIESLTKTLLRDTVRYRGEEGRQRAVQDARSMVEAMRSGGEDDDAAFARGFSKVRPPSSGSPSAEDIAYTAKKHGIPESEVRRRLGIK